MTATTTRARGKAQATLDLIEACLEILTEIQPATVRACCYRLFTRGLIPDMSKASTNRVSRALVGAREDGAIRWEWIVDETREAERITQWSDPDEIIAAAVHGYRRDAWQDQPRRVEIWSEKGTVRGTLQPVLRRLGVMFRVMHGFASATTVRQIADESRTSPKPLAALYVGDFDPSGMFMSEVDLPARLARYGAAVELRRVALLPGHLDGLPSFAAETKVNDGRHAWYVGHYGRQCWELDALSPVRLREDVETAITGLMDPDAWQRACEVEQAQVQSLQHFHNEWTARLLAGGAA